VQAVSTFARHLVICGKMAGAFGDVDLKAFLGSIEWEDKNEAFDTFVLGIFRANGIKAGLLCCAMWLRLVRSMCRTYRRFQI
jgi:hypothetical protein